MTKAELIERIARARNLPPDISKKDIEKIVSAAFDEIANYFARSKVTRTSSPRFTFPRFGTFTKKRRSARRGVNPRTLEPIQIDAFNTLDFRTSRELREAMNPGRAHERDDESPRAGRRERGAKSDDSMRRRLTPRDDRAELAELDELVPDDDTEGALPASPLQRVRKAGAGSRARTG
jgi:nucleoid DNA-binding protein